MSGLTLAQIVRLPWDWQGPTLVEEEGSVHWEIRIGELPDFLLAGTSREEVLSELRPALRAYLSSYLERGQEPPLPARPLLWQCEVVQSGWAPAVPPTTAPATSLPEPVH